MKTVFPNNILSRPTRSRRALTILEMLVSTALLSFIVLGLTAMFIETQKAFKAGLKQTNVTDSGRAIIDMIASDLSQMSDPHFTNSIYSNNVLSGTPALSWTLVPSLAFTQVFTNNGVTVYRTNQSEDVFAMVQTNSQWIGIGYTVSNWFTNTSGGGIPGVGTLYRYVATTTVPFYPTNSIFTNFTVQIAYGTFTNTFFHRIADGVVLFKIYAFNADGNEMYWEQGQNIYSSQSFQYPELETNNVTGLLQTNYLPHSIDIELGVLEPEAFQHIQSLYASGATAAAQNLLANSAGQVQIFRQHILIPAAP